MNVQQTTTWPYELLMRVRPCQLADMLKVCLRIRRQRVTTRTNHAFCVDPVSILGVSLMRAGVYEPAMTQLLYKLLGPSDTFLDVGGNEGYFSVIASTLAPGGAVHCIEPQARLHPVLRANFELNRSTNVVAHRTALSDQDGVADLFVRPSTNTGASSMFRHWKLGDATESVPCTTLDAFFDKNRLSRVKLMKVDCEGAECLVVAGGRSVLERGCIDFIAMEYHPSICGVARCRATHQAICEAGYCFRTVNGECVYHLPGHEDELSGLDETPDAYSWLI